LHVIFNQSKKNVYQHIEYNLLLLDISIRTLWIRSSTGATNEFAADLTGVRGT